MTTRIAHISIQTHCNKLGGKVWNPEICWTDKHAVFVTLQDTEGQKGTGECWCFDTVPDALVVYLKTEVIPSILGMPLDDVFQITKRLFAKATLTARHGILASALAGVDIAMWELISKRSGKPLWKALSERGSGRACLYASGGLYGVNKTPTDLACEMVGHAACGFRLMKMKVGALPLEEDIVRVRSVIAALPQDANVIIDAVYSYSSDEALRLFEALPTDRIEAFQSPTKAWDYAGMAQLTKAGVPVMATEAEYRPELQHKLIEDVQIAYLQTAPIATGGLSPIMALAQKVSKTSTQLSLEVSSTAIALMAAVHAAAAYSEIAHVERHTIHTVFFNALRLEPDQSKPFRVTPPNESGLGVELPNDQVSFAFRQSEKTFPKDAA